MQLKREDLEKAKQIKEFLENNYEEGYGYKLLCKKFAINKKHLVMAFTTVSNDTIHVFHTKVRIEHAKKLLTTTQLNIGLIAVRVGLDKSNFNIQFKKYTGKTPTKWREEKMNEGKLHETSVSKK
jgi:two-component system response regulator YesN